MRLGKLLKLRSVGSVEETIDSIKAGASGLNQVDRAALAQSADSATVVDAPKAKLNPVIVMQFVKFGIVGMSNTLLILAVYTALIKGFGMWYLAASAIGFAVGTVNGFVWNSRWTFRGHVGDALTPVRWFAVQGCGLVADLGLVFLFVHEAASTSSLGQVCTTAIVTVFTFIANRAWTFRMDRRRSGRSGRPATAGNSQQREPNGNPAPAPDRRGLQLQRPLQQPVQRRRRHPQVEARFGRAAVQAVERAQRDRDRQQQRVEVGGVLALPTGRARGLLERGEGVAAAVLVDPVVATPQPLIGGHRHQQRPAGRQHAPQLAQRTAVVGQVLDHIEAHREVEGVGGEGHLHHRALHDLADVAGAGKLGAGGGDLHADHPAAPRELHHVAPAAAAGVEDSRAGGQAEARDRALEHVAASAIPPVAVLRPVGLQLEVAVHRDHLS